MTGAPLPPHERSWRHPSEVGRVVHEPSGARSSAIIVSTAAVGLLLVALLVVAVTPGGSPGQVASPGAPATGELTSWASGPAATRPTTTAATSAPSADPDPDPTDRLPVTTTRATAPTTTRLDATTVRVTTTLVVATTMATTETTATTATSTAAVLATVVATLETFIATTLAPIETEGVVVPVGRGVALMAQPEVSTMNAGETVIAELPSGSAVTAVVVAADAGGLVVVSVPSDDERYDVAEHRYDDPAPEDTVHVHGREVAVVTMDRLAELDVADGTPVTDGDGKLVGLCVEDPASGATTMMVIDRARVDAIDGSD